MSIAYVCFVLEPIRAFMIAQPTCCSAFILRSYFVCRKLSMS